MRHFIAILILTVAISAQTFIPPPPIVAVCGDEFGLYPEDEIGQQVQIIHQQGCNNATWFEHGKTGFYFIYGIKTKER